MISRRLTPWAVLALAAAMAAGLAGCEDSARRPVANHPPPPPSSASAPQPTPFQYTADKQLPLEAPKQTSPTLNAAPPNGPNSIDRLLAQVGAVYDQGWGDLAAGHLAAAQQQFDLARNLLIQSGFVLDSDARLATLRNRIAEGSARASAPLPATPAQQATSADAASAPAPASPLDEIPGMAGAPEGAPTTRVDPGLRSSAEVELQEIPHDLPLTVNDVVLSYLNFFQTTHGRAIVETGLTRAGRYRSMIETVLREEGLPTDLMYIAQAESAFQPQALSRAGARGLWQFMSYRGKEYGLEHTTWVDDRQDPEKATRAAAHHLRDLYAMFGDWYLVLAAYNSGPGTVQHAVERTGYADFWELYRLNVLPKETKNYVPIILALTLIAKDPARYGIEVQPEEPLQSDDVMPGHPLSLRLVAEAMDLDLDDLRVLNPRLLGLETPADPAFILHLPPGTADRFATEMAEIPADRWLTWREHRAQAGETLAGVARTYHVSPGALAELNGLEADYAGGVHQIVLDAGTKLIIPAPEQTQAPLGTRLRYRTRQGDTLESVADEFDVTVADLKKWNHLRSDHIPVGTRLTVYPAGSGPIPASKKAAHTTLQSSHPA